MPDEHTAQCPYCGEEVTLSVEEVGVAQETYVEDCPVCCRPWTVTVSRTSEGTFVNLARDDD